MYVYDEASHYINYLDLRFDCFTARFQSELCLNDRKIKRRGRLYLLYLTINIIKEIISARKIDFMSK